MCLKNRDLQCERDYVIFSLKEGATGRRLARIIKLTIEIVVHHSGFERLFLFSLRPMAYPMLKQVKPKLSTARRPSIVNIGVALLSTDSQWVSI